MFAEDYQDDLERARVNGHSDDFKSELVDLVRNLNRDKGEKLYHRIYHEIYPFAYACDSKFSIEPEEGASEVQEALRDTKKTGGKVKDVPGLLAWLWYYHEEKAKLLYDRFDLPYTPFQGEPELRYMPIHIVDYFNEKKGGSSYDTDLEQLDLGGDASTLSDSNHPVLKSDSDDEAATQDVRTTEYLQPRTAGFRSMFSPEFAIGFVASCSAVIIVYITGLFGL